MKIYYRIDNHGDEEWRNEYGYFHRLDGPASIWTNGSKFWYVNGDRHRIDGPAREWADGSKEWWVKGIRHRIDGPAIDYGGGYADWYINGNILFVDEWVKENNFTIPFDDPTQMMFLMKFG